MEPKSSCKVLVGFALEVGRFVGVDDVIFVTFIHCGGELRVSFLSGLFVA